jgi:hypothetical protein
MGGYYTARTWVAAESRLKNVARALVRAASRLFGTLASTFHKCLQECRHGGLGVRATPARKQG